MALIRRFSSRLQLVNLLRCGYLAQSQHLEGPLHSAREHSRLRLWLDEPLAVTMNVDRHYYSDMLATWPEATFANQYHRFPFGRANH